MPLHRLSLPRRRPRMPHVQNNNGARRITIQKARQNNFTRRTKHDF